MVNNWGNEEGFLGLAFDPGSRNNHYFYVNYTAAQPGRTIILHFTADPVNVSVKKSSEYS